MPKMQSGAALAFNAQARKLKDERNLTWSEAYAAVKKEFPKYWDAMPDDDAFKQILSDGLLRNRQRAATRFSELVFNRQSRLGCDFKTAWDQTSKAEADLYSAMADE